MTPIRIPATAVLGATACILALALTLAHRPALAETGQTGGFVAVLPVAGEGVDSSTLEIARSIVEEKASSLGWSVLAPAKVNTAVQSECPSGTCTDSTSCIAAGKAAGANISVAVYLTKQGDDISIHVYAFDVQAGTTEQAAAQTTASGVLARIVKLLAVVLPAPSQEASTAPVPSPAPSTGPAPSVKPGVSSEPEGEGEPVPPAGPAPLPPGENVPPSGDESDTAGKAKDGQSGLEGGAGGEPVEPDADGEAGKPAVVKDQSGRLQLALSSTMYAMLLGFTITYAAGVGRDEWYWYPVAMLLGGGTALAASLLITWKLKVTEGDAAMFEACLGWGTSNGVLIPLAAGMLEDERPILIGSVIGGGVGLVGGILAAALTDPSRGDAALVSTFATWGSAYASLITLLVLPTDWRDYMIATVVGLDVGLAAGIVASIFLDVSPQRLGIITLAGTIGSLLGGAIGLAFLLKSNVVDDDWRSWGGLMLGFTTLGLVLGIVLSSDKIMDRIADRKKNKKKAKVSALPYLVAHDQEGWKLGVPGIAPLVDPSGTRGAQLGLVGGVF